MITEKEVKKKIIEIAAASGTAGLGQNYARILPGIQLKDGKWNGDLSVTANNAHKGKIHSWMVGVVNGGQKRKGARVDHFWGFRLRGYLFVWDNGDDDNSDDYFGDEIAQVKRAFAEKKYLDLDQTATGFMHHDEIQETNRAVQHSGNGSAHVVNLYLGCHLHENITNP